MDYSKYFWQGKKVRLRPLNINDAEQSFLNSLDSSSRQVLQLGIELPTTVELQKEFMEKYVGCKDVEGIIIFGIENLEGEDVGGISLHGRNIKNGTFGIGLCISAPFQQKGYAEDAMRILLRYCFDERRFQKCNSGCVHDNKASIKLHKKLGFIEEGRRRRNFYMNSQYYDDLLFGLTREEFYENKKQNL